MVISVSFNCLYIAIYTYNGVSGRKHTGPFFGVKYVVCKVMPHYADWRCFKNTFCILFAGVFLVFFVVCFFVDCVCVWLLLGVFSSTYFEGLYFHWWL